MAYAEDCKSFYTGSIPVPTSKKNAVDKKKTCFLFFFGVDSILLFQRSSVVEQSAVNRLVVGSSPTAGAIKAPLFLLLKGAFLVPKIRSGIVQTCK